MAYRVVDSEFNRANYKSMIGQTFDTAPAYAQVVEVKGPGECGEVAAGVFRVFATSEALTAGWDRIPPEMREEYLGKIEKRVEKLVNDKKITTETSKDVLDTLRTLKQVNQGTAQISLTPEDKLMPRIIKMAVSSIGECVCGTKTEIIQNHPPARGTVKVDVWEERDRLIISLEDKESGLSYATWVDEDARQMFEEGFFKPGDKLEGSVLDYAEEMGIISK